VTECQRPFDEALLTGYLDQVLTQEEEQRVRLHLEDCAACRSLVDDLKEMREAAMTTQFNVPTDDQWREAPRGAASSLAFGLGWLMVIVWLVGISGFVLGQLWSGPETLTEKLLAFGLASGVALLFFSVLIDRIRTYKTDRYRRVQK